jgi:hypothetical protein
MVRHEITHVFSFFSISFCFLLLLIMEQMEWWPCSKFIRDFFFICSTNNNKRKEKRVRVYVEEHIFSFKPIRKNTTLRAAHGRNEKDLT